MQRQLPRLLPPTDDLGWTPYIWLIYLGFFLLQPMLRAWEGTLPRGEALLVVLGTAVFLVSYFAGFWLRGKRLGVVIALQTALGVALLPITEGAMVFFAYAASFAGNLVPSRLATRAIGAVGAVAAITLIVAEVPWLYVGPGVVMPCIIGFVNLHYAERRRADVRLRMAQDQIARLAAVAERERIARDLHDVLGHTLSLIVLKAELTRKLVTRDPVRAAHEVHDVELVARDALRQVRQTIRGYRATFVEEIERARTLLEAAVIHPVIAVPPTVAAVSHHDVLGLALREAVTNVVRHAGATQCWISAECIAGSTTLHVEDDGAARQVTEGGGLRGMRERVEAVGGTVTWGPRPQGVGLRLSVRLPSSECPADASRSPRAAAVHIPGSVPVPSEDSRPAFGEHVA